MFNSTNGIIPVTDVGNNNGNDGMWGNGGWWIILLVILFSGYGFANNGLGGNGGAVPYIMTNQTDNEVSRGFDNMAITTKLDAISSNLSDKFYNLSIQDCSAFDNVNSNITSLGYNMQNSLLQVSNLIDNVKYENAQNASAIIQANNENTQRLLDVYTQNQIQDLRDRLQNAEFENSQATQTANIVNQLQPVARPSYIVQSPYQSQMMGCSCCGNM